MKRLVLVDGNALLHRAYHATPPFTTSKGELVNAVYGFSSMVLRVISELHPEFLVIAWDEKGPTFRHQAYTQYKATRTPADDGLSGQYERVHEIVHALNIPEFSLSGYEADDLIGTLALQTEKIKDLETIIVTGDRDIMQLINKRIKVFMPKKTLSDVGLYGIEEFVAKYGFFPKQLIDYKGLAGDASDNIPGVPGIGDVTATKLIHQFGSVEEIYKAVNLKSLPLRTQTLLSEGAESAVMSKSLATLDLKAPIKLDLKQCIVHDFEREKVVKLFEELEFKSLISRIPGVSVIPASSPVIASTSTSLSVNSAKQSSPGYNPTQIASSQIPQSDNEQNQQTSELDKAVEPVLKRVSETGVLVDLKFLNRFGKQLKTRIARIEKGIYSKVGHQFNLNSPKQLSEVLFDELKLPVIRKTKTGRSTDEATLRELALAHPILPLLLEYRQLFKLVSTYIDALPKAVAKDGRIHSTFNVEGAATGRISSKDPNLQNIPVKGEAGGEIRKAFVAPKGKVLLAADYSQIELRIMAHLADDPGLKKAFEENWDIHALTASKIFDVPLEKVTKMQRMVGKTMNFATLYGQGPHALSRQLEIPYELARQYIDEYFTEFPKVRKWMEDTLAFGYENGFVETIWGRKRYIPELKVGNRMIRAAGERAAVNHPVQGTAADMIKKAMVEIDKSLESRVKSQGEKSRFSTLRTCETSSQDLATCKEQVLATSDSCRMILQVHDELLFECDPKSVKETAKMVKEKMESALKLSVPVIAEVKSGPNWGEMKPLHF